MFLILIDIRLDFKSIPAMRPEHIFSTLCVEEMVLTCGQKYPYRISFGESSLYREGLIWREPECLSPVPHWNANLFVGTLKAKHFHVLPRLRRLQPVLKKIKRGRLHLSHREFGFWKFGYGEF
jgi:hypothetical protein